jgi:hypothetical protein
MNDLRLEEKARKRMTCSTLTVANQVINDYTNRSAGSIAGFTIFLTVWWQRLAKHRQGNGWVS